MSLNSFLVGLYGFEQLNTQIEVDKELY